MGAIRALLEAGIFHAIPTGGKSISAKELSAKTGVDKEVIGRYHGPASGVDESNYLDSTTYARSYPNGTIPRDRGGGIRPHVIFRDLHGTSNDGGLQANVRNVYGAISRSTT